MATTRAPGAPPLAPDFGPALPALLRRRFGIRERVTTAVALGLAGLVAAALLLHAYLSRPEQLVYRAGPTFNLQYSSDLLHRVAPQGDELVRLEARRGKLSAAITVTRLRLPPYGANVTSGLLPVYEDRYEQQLRASSTRFVKRDEGSARVNDAQGYQVGFRTGAPGRFTWGRDLLLVPGDEDVRDGVVLHLRQTKEGGPLTKRDDRVLGRVKRALKSFDFGTERAEW